MPKYALPCGGRGDGALEDGPRWPRDVDREGSAQPCEADQHPPLLNSFGRLATGRRPDRGSLTAHTFMTEAWRFLTGPIGFEGILETAPRMPKYRSQLCVGQMLLAAEVAVGPVIGRRRHAVPGSLPGRSGVGCWIGGAEGGRGVCGVAESSSKFPLVDGHLQRPIHANPQPFDDTNNTAKPRREPPSSLFSAARGTPSS
jgi:hypothetical protein